MNSAREIPNGVRKSIFMRKSIVFQNPNLLRSNSNDDIMKDGKFMFENTIDLFKREYSKRPSNMIKYAEKTLLDTKYFSNILIKYGKKKATQILKRCCMYMNYKFKKQNSLIYDFGLKLF